MNPKSADKYLIVGVNGQFGRIFARKLALTGAEVSGVDLQDLAFDATVCKTYLRASLGDDLNSATLNLANAADCVLLCTPEEAIVAALPTLCSALAADKVVIDIASVKGRIDEAFLKIHSDVGYISIHPMFGPMEDFSGRAVCIVTMRDNERARSFAKLIGGWGADISQMTADEHDATTALVQALPHAVLIAFGAALASSNAKFEVVWSIATPIQKLMMALAARVATSGDHETYWSIQSANPSASHVRDSLSQELRKLSATVEEGRPQGFGEILDSIEAFLKPGNEGLSQLAAQAVLLAKN